MIESVRNHYIALYFQIMNDQEQNRKDDITIASDEINDADEGFGHQCMICNQGTFYNEKPPHDYPFPLCLTDFCLSIHIKNFYNDI